MPRHCFAVYEAVLPLPNCMKEEGCRSILERKDGNDGFELDGDFIISTKVFLQIFTIPSNSHVILQK